jgi:hypothetical protein
MKIEATVFTREDGVVLFRTADKDRWIIRKVEGPAWFYNPNDGIWELAHTVSSSRLASMALPFNEAFKLLETVKK